MFHQMTFDSHCNEDETKALNKRYSWKKKMEEYFIGNSDWWVLLEKEWKADKICAQNLKCMHANSGTEIKIIIIWNSYSFRIIFNLFIFASLFGLSNVKWISWWCNLRNTVNGKMNWFASIVNNLGTDQRDCDSFDCKCVNKTQIEKENHHR